MADIDVYLDVEVKVKARPVDPVNTPRQRNEWTTIKKLTHQGYYDKYAVATVAGEAAETAAFLRTGGLLLPTAVPEEPTSVTTTTATLNGLVNAQGVSTVITFLWGEDPDSPTESAATTGSPATGSTPAATTFDATGLTAETTYYFRVKGVSATGTTISELLSFTTPAT